MGDFCLQCGQFVDSTGVAKKDHSGHQVQAWCLTCDEPVAGGAHDGHHVVTAPSNNQIMGVYYTLKATSGKISPQLQLYADQVLQAAQPKPQAPNQ